MEDKFKCRIKSYIYEHKLLRSDAPIVVAVSGGADSIALLVVLKDLGYDCIAAHCNFHLRGDESMRDMYHVKAIATKLGVSLLIKDFDVPAQMAATGQSIEMACRQLRYDWFRVLLDEYKAQAIAVGHHREDQVETFLLNLLRGTGITGLTGMSPISASVVRPLLTCSRAEIEGYLADKKIDYIVDSSNLQNDYKRNKLRNIVIPQLDELFDGATNAILATMSHLTDNKRLYDFATKSLADRFIDADNVVDVQAMRSSMPIEVADTLLYEIIKPYNFNITQARNIIRANGTSCFSSATHRAEFSRGFLSISSHSDGVGLSEVYRVDISDNINTPLHICVSRHNISDFAPKRDNSTIYLDAEVLKNNPMFEIRHWQKGDVLKPFGMNGSKLVSDIYQDAKLSAQQKREAWLLTRNGEILWIVGIRASSLFAVSHNTTTYLRLSI
jgi:tRNA(Ile)-lysidine synthase